MTKESSLDMIKRTKFLKFFLLNLRKDVDLIQVQQMMMLFYDLIQKYSLE